MTDFYTHANNTAPNVALAHTVYGDPVEAIKPVGAANENVVRAVGSVFSDYKPPPLPKQGPCAIEGCRSTATVGDTGHCVGHARKLGLIENWGKDGRQHEPQ